MVFAALWVNPFYAYSNFTRTGLCCSGLPYFIPVPEICHANRSEVIGHYYLHYCSPFDHLRHFRSFSLFVAVILQGLSFSMTNIVESLIFTVWKS